MQILTIALLLRLVMRRRFSTLQWEALCLLLIGISINQLSSGSTSTSSLQSLPLPGYVCTLLTVSKELSLSPLNLATLVGQFVPFSGAACPSLCMILFSKEPIMEKFTRCLVEIYAIRFAKKSLFNSQTLAECCVELPAPLF
jgi:hypothetical protein